MQSARVGEHLLQFAIATKTWPVGSMCKLDSVHNELAGNKRTIILQRAAAAAADVCVKMFALT